MTIARAFVAFLLLAASTAACADADGRRIDELMRASGLWAQLGQSQAQIRAGMAQSPPLDSPLKPSPLKPEDLARIGRGLVAAFEPDGLRATAAAEMARVLSREDETAALAWLNSPLGLRITRMEESATESMQEPSQVTLARKILDEAPASRRALLERIVVAVNAAEGGADLMIQVSTAILYGAQSALQMPDNALLQKLRREAAARRPAVVRAMREQMLVTFAYSYRELPDDALGSYVEFMESPQGRRYNDASMKAVEAAFTRASLAAGERIARDATRERESKRSS